jgi:hypothetical protein
MWLALLLSSFFLLGQLLVPGNNPVTNVAFAAVTAFLAGGVGGTIALLERVARQVAIGRNIHKQKLLSYWLQPPLGSFFGFLSLVLIAIPGSLIATLAPSGVILHADSFVSPTFTALQLLIAWTAGFYRQQTGHWAKLMPATDALAVAPQTRIKRTGSMAYKACLFSSLQPTSLPLPEPLSDC